MKAPELTVRTDSRRGLPPAPVDRRSGREGRAGREDGASRARKWAITLAATAVSTYALDAVATAAGLLLAASHVLGGLDRGVVLVFLAGTYVLWGAGLRVNLEANWTLLEKTGTSTNVVSKAAYDLAKLGTSSVRAQRIASAAGYAGTELAKEAPYYAGAFGTALLSDSVSSTDALIFLAGANLGAAAYEYGLARMTRAFLLLKSRRARQQVVDDPPSGVRQNPRHREAAEFPPTKGRPAAEALAVRLEEIDESLEGR